MPGGHASSARVRGYVSYAECPPLRRSLAEGTRRKKQRAPEPTWVCHGFCWKWPTVMKRRIAHFCPRIQYNEGHVLHVGVDACKRMGASSWTGGDYVAGTPIVCTIDEPCAQRTPTKGKQSSSHSHLLRTMSPTCICSVLLNQMQDSYSRYCNPATSRRHSLNFYVYVYVLCSRFSFVCWVSGMNTNLRTDSEFSVIIRLVRYL